MQCAGILLTGGASARMGTDKATLRLKPGDAPLAQRAALVLAAVAAPVIEVGQGVSDLPSISDDRRGPLVAIVRGVDELAVPWRPVLVLACDMPRVTVDLLEWLARHPGAGSVVPVGGDPPQPQPLCARWSPAAQHRMRELVAAGEQSLRSLHAGGDVHLAEAAEWSTVADARALDDVDTPSDLWRLERS